MTSRKEVTYVEVLSRDIFKGATYEIRKSVLISGSVAVMLYFGGLAPEKITWAGIVLSYEQQIVARVFIGLVVGYYLCLFAVRATFELVAWGSVLLFSDISDEESRPEKHSPERILELLGREKSERRIRKMRAVVWPLAIGRAAFEYLIPLIVGVCGIVAVLR